MATSAPERQAVGLLGGTFDPIHLGHLRLGWEAYVELGLARVILMPCHQPTHRDTPQVSAAQRYTMAVQACRHIRGFEVSDWELQRDLPSYSVETLAHLRSELGLDTPLVFIMGMDAFCGLSRWHQWQRLLTLCHLWIAQRPDAPLPEDGTVEDTLLRTQGTSTPAALLEQPHGRLYVHSSTDLAISATALRTAIQQGKDPRFLVPDAVRHYIQQHQLYQSANHLAKPTSTITRDASKPS